MIRLFVALELPPATRDRLLATMGGVAGARWQNDGQLHLTLRFIGEVDRHQAEDIVAALGSVHVVPFQLSFGDIGTFDRRGKIDSLWVGVTPQAEVTALAKRVDQALVRVGVPPATRAFVPHVTVARFGRDIGPLDGFPMAPLSREPFDVSGFALWESKMGRDGSVYSVVERYGVLPSPGQGGE